MSAATAPLNRDIRVISLIGVAHGVSHYYQLAFATMLLIVRQEAGLSFTDVGLLMAIFYGVSGVSQTAAGFAVDRFGARPILAGGLAVIGCALALISVAHSFVGFAAIAVIGGLGNCRLPSCGLRAPERVGESWPARPRLQHPRCRRLARLGGRSGDVLPRQHVRLGGSGADRRAAGPDPVGAGLDPSQRARRPPGQGAGRCDAAWPDSHAGLFLQPAILLCLVYFALLSATTVGIQQFAVPAWASMFGISENYAALCLIVFIVGSAGGVLVGGFFADRVRRHDRIATLGLLVAGALTVPIAAQAVTPALLLPLLALAGAAGGITNPSRDMIVRNATPPGASGKVFGFVYSGLDVGSFLAPPVFGFLMTAGLPSIIFWVAVGLYLVNAALVLVIRQTTVPAVVTAAAE